MNSTQPKRRSIAPYRYKRPTTDGLKRIVANDAPRLDGDNPEVNIDLRLSSDRSLVTTPARHLFRDYRANADAFRHLDTLPAKSETLHGVISGKYALWDLVPALIERTGQKIADLHLATLSYSKANAAELLGLLDGGQVGRVGLIVSAYFKAQNRDIYDSLVPSLLSRNQRVVAYRQHAKVILARMGDGTTYAVTSSANMRSCRNTETFDMANHAGVYDFHRRWIEEVLAGGAGGNEEGTGSGDEELEGHDEEEAIED